MAKVLNYFELVAHAVSSGIADEDMMKSALQNAFYNWYNVLKEFRESMTKQRKYDPWAPVAGLYKRWYSDAESIRFREQTGRAK
jgi:hypothetical protein